MSCIVLKTVSQTKLQDDDGQGREGNLVDISTDLSSSGEDSHNVLQSWNIQSNVGKRQVAIEGNVFGGL